MTVGVINNWVDLGVNGRLDLDALTVAGATVVGGNPVLPEGTPASATATGVKGSIKYDATHLYVCIATNTWVRADLATWV